MVGRVAMNRLLVCGILALITTHASAQVRLLVGDRTNDAVYRLTHVDCHRDYNEAGEIAPYVADGPSGFGTGNTSYVPGEICFDANGVGFVHDSGTLHGIYRFRDVDNSGRADDAGE